MSRKKQDTGNVPGGLELRTAREARGLSLRMLAERAGVTIHTIQRHELGYTEMRPSTAAKVVRALNRVPKIERLK